MRLSLESSRYKKDGIIFPSEISHSNSNSGLVKKSLTLSQVFYSKLCLDPITIKQGFTKVDPAVHIFKVSMKAL